MIEVLLPSSWSGIWRYWQPKELAAMPRGSNTDKEPS